MPEPLRLGDHCTKIGSGATPRGGKDSYLESGPYRLIRSQNIYNSGFSNGGLVCISEEQASTLSNVEVLPEDILLNITGDSVARTCQVDSAVLPARVNQHVAIVRPNPDEIDPRFLRFFLISPGMQSLMLTYAGAGATRNALTKSMIENFEVPRFPIEVQRGIGRTLGALEDKIDCNRRMNETLEAMARAMFKDWFVDFGPTKAKMEGRPPYLAPEIWDLFPDRLDDEGKPEGWRMTTLGSLTSKIGSGATPRGGKGVYVSEGTNFIRSQNVYDFYFKWDGLVQLSDEDSAQLRNVAVKPDDVLINITGDSILRTCVVDPGVLPARVNQHVCIVRAVKGIPARFLHLWLAQQSAKHWLLGNDAGGSRKAVTKGHLESLPIIQPSTETLEKFSELSSHFYNKAIANTMESRILAQTRDLLLPKLMSGEIRVKGAERAVEDVL
ncbi:MAG: restriction endonuclease subunit S [Pseudodesulfovibrio sp.]|uniref:Restriction endonuclease subunit S n=1 Tax=Pseudodesulfovibrio methanolicus TaxID=3126690 RepID=A0ABZ2ISP4_9BACT